MLEVTRSRGLEHDTQVPLTCPGKPAWICSLHGNMHHGQDRQTRHDQFLPLPGRFGRDLNARVGSLPEPELTRLRDVD